ncbi:hypothetical protein OC861_001127 [Tilletia horrida]|nr:hypothetical protein OC861_001127 [Tilletia horrida]
MQYRLAASFLLAALLALTQTALANLVVHSPVAATKAEGGKSLQVEWVDDGKAPTAKSYGAINVFLCTGSSTVQYKLQELKGNLSTKTKSGSWKIDPSVGPNSDKYFLRFEGTNVSAAGVPPMAFSARFSISGMKGTWNSTITSTNQGASDPGTTSSKGLTTVATSTSTSSTYTLRPATSPTTTSPSGAAAPGARFDAPISAAVSVGATLLLVMLAAGVTL